MTPSDSNPLAGRILSIRGQRVVLDADLARLYGVPTKRFNEAVKRNAKRFPKDFAFQLAREEFIRMRSQFATTSQGGAAGGEANWSQFATSSKASRRGKAYRPWAFTEHGAVMAANVMRSDVAAVPVLQSRLHGTGLAEVRLRNLCEAGAEPVHPGVH